MAKKVSKKNEGKKVSELYQQALDLVQQAEGHPDWDGHQGQRSRTVRQELYQLAEAWKIYKGGK